MNSLARLIGPAPSELPFEDLLEKIGSERARVRRNLLWFQTNAPRNKPVRPTKATTPKRGVKMATAAKRAGVSLEDIARAIALVKAQKEGS